MGLVWGWGSRGGKPRGAGGLCVSGASSGAGSRMEGSEKQADVDLVQVWPSGDWP